MEPTCPQCHTAVRATDFFCYNCGKNLKTKPLATTPEALIPYYLGAVILPPMGIIWGYKYLKQADQTSKTHGAVLIALTVIELILLTIWSVNFFNSINVRVNQQLNGLRGF